MCMYKSFLHLPIFLGENHPLSKSQRYRNQYSNSFPVRTFF